MTLNSYSEKIIDTTLMVPKKNVPLILGLLTPVLMVVFVIASIYIPGIFSQPKSDFLYSMNDSFYTSVSYDVQNGHLIENPIPTRYPEPAQHTKPKLYLYKVTENKSSQITFQEAQGYKIDTDMISPDGYKLENGSQGSGVFPFYWYSSDYKTQYLVGHSVSKKLNIPSTSSYFNSFHFLGWIVK